MPRTCAACNHANRSEIDELLVNGASIRNIAERFRISSSGIFRHFKAHLAKSLTRAKAAEQVADADTVLARVEELLARAWRMADAAEHSKQLDTALRGIGQVRSCLELLARLSGELKTQATTVNIAIALRDMGDDQVKQLLLDAGQAGWNRVDPSKRAANAQEILTLLAKGLRGSTQDQIRRVLIDAGNCDAFLGVPALPAETMPPPTGKPN